MKNHASPDDPIESLGSSKGHINENKPKIRLGLLGKKILLKGENPRKFEEFRLKIEEELLAVTEIEKLLVEKIISSAWKHFRSLEIERNILSSQNTPTFADPEEEEMYTDKNYGEFAPKKRIRNIRKIRLNTPEIEALHKHQTDLEKGMLKALQRLREEQVLRLGKGQ